MDDPAKLMVMVERSINRLEEEIAEASGDLGAVRSDLQRTVEDIERVEESWLRRRITTQKRDILVKELEQTREVLEDRLDEMSPERRAALEEKQQLLVGACDYLRTLENRVEHGIPSWKFTFHPGAAESEELNRFRSSEFNSFSRGEGRVGQTLDEVLTEFNMTAVFGSDRVELKGDIELDIPDDKPHPHAAAAGED